MNQIVRNLYIGNMNDGVGVGASMDVLCVMWDGEPGIPPQAHRISTTIYDGATSSNVHAIPEKMDEAADWIETRLREGFRVLVHCAYGVERSPLTVVWYLMRHQGMNLSEAYKVVLERRPEAQYRGTWLPIDIRLSGALPERSVR